MLQSKCEQLKHMKNFSVFFLVSSLSIKCTERIFFTDVTNKAFKRFHVELVYVAAVASCSVLNERIVLLCTLTESNTQCKVYFVTYTPIAYKKS